MFNKSIIGSNGSSESSNPMLVYSEVKKMDMLLSFLLISIRKHGENTKFVIPFILKSILYMYFNFLDKEIMNSCIELQ